MNILIWSFEHGRWWAPGGFGYVDDVEKSGRYTEEQAKEICRRANFVGINEAMMPIGEHTLGASARRSAAGHERR
jgi:hypothetical protein